MRNAASRRDAIPRIEGIGEGGANGMPQAGSGPLDVAHRAATAAVWPWTLPSNRHYRTDPVICRRTHLSWRFAVWFAGPHGVHRCAGGDRITLWLKALSSWSSRASRRPVTLPWSL